MAILQHGIRANIVLRQPGSRVPMLGIYLGHIGERNHFYAINGKWASSMGFSSMFTVSGFATAAELQPVLAKIPEDGTPGDFDKLREENGGPSREDARELINKMMTFRSRAEKVYQSNMERLDGARVLLADPSQITYMNLYDMAKTLLPGSVKADGKVPAYILYAVHGAIQRCENTFYPLSPSSAMHLKTHIFEVLPLSVTTMMERIALLVRDYVVRNIAKDSNPSSNAARRRVALDSFAEEAKRALALSESQRKPTPYGIVEPSNSVELERFQWSPASKEIIGFLEWWAGYGLFNASSRFHAYGAVILRSLKTYNKVPLDQATAWTFLQETNVITPWENPSRYKVRLPHTKIVRGKGLARLEPESMDESVRPDIAEGHRDNRGKSTVFCIDGPSTVVIDDGVSLERTSAEDEFWIHVHVADPTSKIKPKSDLATYLELIPESIYLPGHYQAMLPASLRDSGRDYKAAPLVDQFSLKNNAPALTFSAKVNMSGDILEHKVSPSTLGNIVYLDPDEVATFCNEPRREVDEGRVLEVGVPPVAEVYHNRPMHKSTELDAQDQKDLQTLYQLTTALKAKRLQDGAWPYYIPRPSVSVRLHKLPFQEDDNAGPIAIPQDPYIKVATETRSGSSLVTDTMVLAGQVAARWCAERSIAIPFRRDSKPGSSGPQVRDFAFGELYPLVEQGIQPSGGQINKLMRLTGRVEISTAPGPYFIQGVDMYTKCTSPLRRYGDMLAHWQIHAALAHEREHGSLVGAAKEVTKKWMPFTNADLREMLPMLEIRERMCRAIGRGSKDWIMIALVRAWKFENNPPRNIVFTVDSRWRKGLSGKIDVFGLPAILDVNGLEGVALINNIQVNDRFEVELQDVNVHSSQIIVKAVKRLARED